MHVKGLLGGLAYVQKMFERICHGGKKKPLRVLAYGQKMFEHLCHGRATKSLLKHLNDDIIHRKWNILDVFNPVAQARGVGTRLIKWDIFDEINYDEVEKVYEKFLDVFWKKYARRELAEEDLIRLIDWYLIIFVWQRHYKGERLWFGRDVFTSYWAKAEHINVIKDYLCDLRKHATGQDFREFLSGYFTPMEEVYKCAEKGDGWAMAELGHIYAEGLHGCAQDYVEAAKWYKKAVEKNPQAVLSTNYPLGKMYALGLGVAQDDEQAVRLYREPAERGNPQAQYELGYMYATGRGVAQDDIQAVHWYRKAAGVGLMEAQYELGNMYATGRGVAQDDEETARQYAKAAEGDIGHAPAQYALGNMYASGCGVAKDEEKAAYWWHRAAGQGLAEAREKLGET